MSNEERLDEALRALPRHDPASPLVEATLARVMSDQAAVATYGRRSVSEAERELSRSLARSARSLTLRQQVSGYLGMALVTGVYVAFIGFLLVQFGRQPDPQPLELPTRSLGLSLATGPTGMGELEAMLRRGELPPRGAVDVGRLVNQFEYDYARPEPQVAALHVDVMRAPWNPEVRLVRVGLTGSASEAFSDVRLKVTQPDGGSLHERTLAGLSIGAQTTDLVEVPGRGGVLVHVEVSLTSSAGPQVLTATVPDAPVEVASADQEWVAAIAYFAQTLWQRAECGMEVALGRAAKLASSALDKASDERRAQRAGLMRLVDVAVELARRQHDPRCD